MKKHFYHIILLLLSSFPIVGLAQNPIFFSVSAVDPTTDQSKRASYTINLNKNVSCLQVQSGLYAWYGIMGNKLFSADCPTGTPLVRIEIKLFPNPVVNYTRLQSNMLLNESPTLQLSIIDATGRIVMRRSISNDQLYAGHSLYLGMLSAGNYFLKIEGASVKQVIQFIKVN